MVDSAGSVPFTWMPAALRVPLNWGAPEGIGGAPDPEGARAVRAATSVTAAEAAEPETWMVDVVV